MNNENEIIEGNFEELELVRKNPVIENSDEYVSNEYRFKNTKKAKRKRRKSYKAILLACVVGAGSFYAGNLYSKYDITININEKGSIEIEENATNTKLNTDGNTGESSELVFNNNSQELKEDLTSESSKSNVNLIEEASKAVVSITTKINNTQSRIPISGESSGSGVIIKEDDKYVYIITNNHVIEGSSALKVTIDDENYIDAKVLGADSVNDIAVIYAKREDFENEDYVVTKIGNSDDLQLTDKVYAIGNSAGEGKSATSGIVSALNKNITFSDGSTLNFIQTDAAINPGNSGGALVDENGYLVGINTAKLIDSTIEGMGYSIPINVAIDIADNLITKPFLGIQGLSVSDVISADLETIGIPNGVYIDSVLDGTGAYKAGIQSGDIITKMDDTTISSFDDLSNFLGNYKVGDRVEVVVYRAGEYVELTLELGSRAGE